MGRSGLGVRHGLRAAMVFAPSPTGTTHEILVSTTRQPTPDSADFGRGRARVLSAEQREAVIFVHGYNTNLCHRAGPHHLTDLNRGGIRSRIRHPAAHIGGWRQILGAQQHLARACLRNGGFDKA